MAMVDIAILEKERGTDRPVKLAEISERQDIALNYLEQIFAKLKKQGIVSSVKGPGGGYFIANGANGTKVLDVIIAAEEDLQMTRCNPENDHGCMPDKARCITHDLWKGLTDNINGYLSSKTLEDVMNKR